MKKFSAAAGLLVFVALCLVSRSWAGSANLVADWNMLGNGAGGTISVATTFGNTAQVSTVWKWLPAKNAWAFYAPSLTAQALTDYATTNHYDVLSTIAPGEGFWVNAKTAFAATLPAGTAVTSASFQTKLPAGWSLIAIGDNKTPSQFNSLLSVTPPTAGAIPSNLTTLWAWDT